MATSAATLDARTPADGVAQGDHEVEFEVSMLSGRRCTIRCPGAATLRELRVPIAASLLVEAEEDSSAMAMLLCFAPLNALAGADDDASIGTEGGAMLLAYETAAWQLAGRCISAVVVQLDTTWCSGKRLKSSYIRGRRCGMQEEGKDTVLELQSNGEFTYSMHDHNHDHEPDFSYNHDQWVRARGHWTLEGEHGAVESERVVLVGTATTTVDTVSVDREVCNGSEEEHESEGEREVDNPNDVHTRTEGPFQLILTKIELMTPDPGWNSRGGWKSTDLA